MTSAMKAEEEHSRVFYNYIRAIGDCKSQQEEDAIVVKDLKRLRKTLASPGLDTLTMKECVTRVFYAEMLGHPAEFGHIHCVNLSSSNNLPAKRIGYLATWLCINPEDDLMYLIVANIHKDMKSSNFVHVAAALDAAGRLLRPELMYTFGDSVGQLLQHNKALVRRKAVETMHAFYVKSHGEIGEQRLFRQALTDRDPSVMDAAVRLFYDVVRTKASAQRDLMDAFLSILSQVVQRRLPREYDYHHIPAPWLQIRLVRLLTLLVGIEDALAKKCEPLFMEMMRRADAGTTIGFAVIAEIVAAAAAMPTLPGLLELCSSAITGFLASPSANVKYMGMKMLSQVASRYPDIAAEHQCTVMDCLEDPDETIRRRTITLLFAICTPDNIGPITHRILKYLAGTTMQTAAARSNGRPWSSGADESGGAPDAYLKRNITRGLCLVAERFAPSASWYMHTMNRILLVAPECVPYMTVQRLLKLIAEGQDGVDEAANVSFRTECVETYFAMTGGGDISLFGSPSTKADHGGHTSASRRHRTVLSPHAVPDMVNRIAAWVMGEYGFLTQKISRAMLMDRLCDMLERADDGSSGTGTGGAGASSSSSSGAGRGISESNGSETRSWIVTALMKLAAQGGGDVSDYILDLVKKFQDSRSVGLQQRCYEFVELTKQPALMRKVLPMDGCCEDLQVQLGLPFLDQIVQIAAAHGAKPFDARKLQAARQAAAGGSGGAGGGHSSELLPMNAYQQHPPPTSAAAATTAATWGGAAGARGALDFERLQAAGGQGIGAAPVLNAQGVTSTLRGRHGAKRWGVKDLQAPPPATAGSGSTSQSTSSQQLQQQQSRVPQPFHADPTSTAASHTGSPYGPSGGGAGQGHARNEKLMKDIFGGTRAAGRQRKTQGIFAGSSPSPTAPQSSVQAAKVAEASSVMDNLFAPSGNSSSATAPSSGALTTPPPAKTTGRVGMKTWGAAGTLGTTVETTPAAALSTSNPSHGEDHGASMQVERLSRTPHETVVTLSLSTRSARGISSCTLEAQAPRGVTVSLHRQGTLDKSPRHAVTKLSLGSLAGGRPVLVDVTVHIMEAEEVLQAMQRDAAVVRWSLVAGAASSSNADDPTSYFLPGAGQSTTQPRSLAQASFPLTPADLLRPVEPEFQTASFGQQWVQTPAESKASIHSTTLSFTDAARLREVLSEVGSLRVVEVIDMEWIAAGRMVRGGGDAASSDGSLLLCHLTITGPKTATVTVRCPNASLRQAFLHALSSK